MKEYKLRYTAHNKPAEFVQIENLSDTNFPVGGHISIYSLEGLGIAHGLLRKDKEAGTWVITDKMLKDVEEFKR